MKKLLSLLMLVVTVGSVSLGITRAAAGGDIAYASGTVLVSELPLGKNNVLISKDDVNWVKSGLVFDQLNVKSGTLSSYNLYLKNDVAPCGPDTCINPTNNYRIATFVITDAANASAQIALAKQIQVTVTDVSPSIDSVVLYSGNLYDLQNATATFNPNYAGDLRGNSNIKIEMSVPTGVSGSVNYKLSVYQLPN